VNNRIRRSELGTIDLASLIRFKIRKVNAREDVHVFFEPGLERGVSA